MNRRIRALRAAMLAALLLFPLAGEASALDPPGDGVAYAYGWCSPTLGISTYTLTQSGVAGTLLDMDVAIQVDGGPGTWSGGQSWSQAGEFWQSGIDPQSMTGTVSCPGASQAFEYYITYVPRRLVTSPFRSFYGTLEGAGSSNSIGFMAGERGYYSAFMHVEGAPLVVRFDDNTQVLQPGQSRLDLGYIAAGPHNIRLEGTAAGRSEYSMQPFEQPAKLTEVANTTHYVRGGGSVPIGLTLSADARVQSEAVDDSDHHVAQHRAAGTPLGMGHQELMWAAVDDTGAPLPDGGYSLYLNALNNYGASGTSETQVVVDSQPPKFSFRLPTAWIGLMQPAIVPLEVGVFDSFADGSLTIDGGPPIRMSKYYLSYLPPGGWAPGQHKATVVATDLAGNVGSASTTFTVPPRTPAQSPYVRADCSTLAIKSAVRNSRTLNATLRRVEHAPRGDLFRHFRVAQRSCSDVTGDFSPELVVLLREQRGPKTVLAIFGRQGNHWKLSFQDAKHRIEKFVPGLFHDVTEMLHGGDTIRVYWNLHRFVLKRA